MSQLPAPIQPPRTRNPLTQARHQREVFWQVAVPVASAVMAAVTLMVAVALPSLLPFALRRPVADVSLMALIVAAAVVGVVMLATLVGLIWLAGYLLKEAPFWFKRAQDLLWLINGHTHALTDQINRRVFDLNAAGAAGAALARDLARLFRSWRSV